MTRALSQLELDASPSSWFRSGNSPSVRRRVRGTVLAWLRPGLLPGQLITDGPRPRWLIHESEGRASSRRLRSRARDRGPSRLLNGPRPADWSGPEPTINAGVPAPNGRECRPSQDAPCRPGRPTESCRHLAPCDGRQSRFSAISSGCQGVAVAILSLRKSTSRRFE
jgi:hypothetical protein